MSRSTSLRVAGRCSVDVDPRHRRAGSATILGMAWDPAEGLYEALLTHALQEGLETASAQLDAGLRELDPDSAPLYLARYVHDRALQALKGAGKTDGLRRQIERNNRLLEVLGAEEAPVVDDMDRVVLPGRLLERLSAKRQSTGLGPAASAPARPLIPLSTSELLVNGRHDLNVASEVRRELQSADRVDLLISFLKFSGIRILQEELQAFLGRRPGGLRVLTTVYTGATEPRALEVLRDLGAQIRVSYDTQRTRLHAKAWLFHRDSGYSTAVVGSSNLSGAAILDGLEWNVRLSNVKQGQRYIHHGSRGGSVLLFVRRTKRDDRGETRPYVFLGPADYESHRGERPIQFVWRLRRPMPARFFEETKVAAG